MEVLWYRHSFRRTRPLIQLIRLRHVSHRASEPLRILFCGSDTFSCASLNGLKKLSAQHPEIVRSIDVVCRPAKRTGRGLKQITTGRCILEDDADGF